MNIIISLFNAAHHHSSSLIFFFFISQYGHCVQLSESEAPGDEEESMNENI